MLIRHTPVFIVASSIVIASAAVAGLPPAFLLPLPLAVALPILAVLLHDTGIVGRWRRLVLIHPGSRHITSTAALSAPSR